ncbi:MAG: DUF2207 domain-containing protein [Lachnospiraceae bacterium]|nr:DUF2207 domain-containing protein [Lachnospiraceae bacterium]
MKAKTFIVIWIAIFALMMLPFLAEYSYVFEEMSLNPNDYARITDVEYKAVVVDEPGSEGKVVITERLTFDVHAASESNLFWELWRDLPEDYVDGVKVDYQVNSVKQIFEDGTELVYEESPKLYWDDYDYISSYYGPGKWYHSEGPYDEADAQYECVFFYIDGVYREEMVFEIEYEMHNAALRYNDCSDLYLALYSGSTCKYLESFKAQILFPNEDMPSPGNYEIFTYGTNSNVFPVERSATLNPGYYTFSFELNGERLQFKPYNEYIEFDLVAYGEDKHIFTEYAPLNLYSSDDVLEEIYDEQKEYAYAPATYMVKKMIIFIVAIVVSVLLIIYVFRTNSRMNKKHVFYKPAMEPEYFRDIPNDLDPNFAAALVFCKHKPPKDDSDVYSAILLSLARKEYIELQTYNIYDVQITVKKASAPLTPEQITLGDVGLIEDIKTYEPLTPCEEYYFNLILRHASNNTLLMSTLQSRVSSDYEYTDSFVRNIEKSIINIGVRDGYFQKADYTQPKKQLQSKAKAFLIIGLLLLTVVNIISYQTRMDLAFGAYFILGIVFMTGSFYMKSLSKKYVLLTQFGEDEYAKWRGLYNFMNSETLISERTFVELPIWEKYLVYATAFGLSDKVSKAISIRCPEAAASPVLSNNCYRSTSFHSSGRSFRRAVRSGSSIARSGGGGSFGYGGGGRGGGGGGGGH